MLGRGQQFAVRDLVAAQLVGDEHARHILQSLEEPPEEHGSPRLIADLRDLGWEVSEKTVCLTRCAARVWWRWPHQAR